MSRSLSKEELERTHIDRAMLGRVWRQAAPYKWLILVQLAIILLDAGVMLLPPLVFKRLIDLVDPSVNGGVRPQMATINWLFAAAIGLAVLMTALNLTVRWLGSRIGEGLIFDLRVALYDHVQRMPLAFFSRTPTGSLLSRLSNDVIGAQSTVTTFTSVLTDIVTLVTVLAAMAALSVRVTLLALLVIPVLIVLDRILGRRLAGLLRRRMSLNADMSNQMTERFNVGGALVVKLFGRPDEERGLFSSRAGKVRDAGVQISVVMRAYYGMLALAGSLGTAAVYWFGARGVLDGALTIGTLTALAAYVTRLYSPLTDLASARTDLLTALVSYDRCFEVLDTPPAITESDRPTPLSQPSAGRLTFDDVHFSYPSAASVGIESLESLPWDDEHRQASEEALHGVSFTARPGDMVALVGASGSGKTTLSNLVPRLYDVTGGSVQVDDVDVRDLSFADLSAAVGVVNQDPHLFHDTIGANLRYARPDATDQEVIDACRAARIHDFILSLPQGFETVVGERGYRLSGGERQRLAIARVLLKQPAIVVLDEATSHLDAENEAAIQEAFDTVLAERTSLVIAHRLSTIVKADQILVLDGGHIIERGTHGELVGAGGRYAGLFATQTQPTGLAGA